MAGDETDRRTRVVLVKLAWGKGAVRRNKYLLLSYCAKAPLIQLTWSGPLRAWPKLEVFSGLMVGKTSWWWTFGSKRGRTCSKMARCYSKEVSVYGCLQAMVSIIDENLARLNLYRIIWTSENPSEGSSLYMGIEVTWEI